MIFDAIRNLRSYEDQERVSEISHLSENSSFDATIGLLEERGGKRHIPKDFIMLVLDVICYFLENLI